MYTRNTWITEPCEAEVKIEEGKEAQDREKKICILKINNNNKKRGRIEERKGTQKDSNSAHSARLHFNDHLTTTLLRLIT